MADKAVKVTWFFNYENGGSSISLYQAYTDNPNYDAALEKGKEFVKAIAKILGGGVQVPYIRASEDVFSGDSFVDASKYYIANATSPAAPQGYTTINGGTDGPPDMADTVIKMGWTGGALSRGRSFIHFIPDSAIENRPGNKVWDVAYRGRVYAFHDEVAEQGWHIKNLKRGAQYLRWQIVKAVVDAVLPNKVVFTTSQAHSFSAADNVKISGLPNFRYWEGVHNLDSTTGDTFTITFKKAFLPVGTTVVMANKPGTVRKIGYEYNAILPKKYNFSASNRKAGRPFGLTPGRRRPQ